MRRRAPRILAFAPETLKSEGELNCPQCKTPLELHQPDVSRPDRLLGICPDCQAWTLVRFDDSGRFKLTVLPD